MRLNGEQIYIFKSYLFGFSHVLLLTACRGGFDSYAPPPVDRYLSHAAPLPTPAPLPVPVAPQVIDTTESLHAV